MDGKYLEIERNVVQARKRLNALMGLRWGITLSISLTLLYLAFFFLGVVGMIEPWWILVLANLVAAVVGMAWGNGRKIEPQNELFQVDLSLNLGEKLTTIYELREMGWHSRVLDALYQRIEHLRIDTRRALGLSKSEKRGWVLAGGLLGGTFLLLFLWVSGVNPVNLGELLSFLRSNEGTITSRYFEEPLITTDERVEESSDNSEIGESSSQERTTRSCGENGEEACVDDESSSQTSSSLERQVREQQQRQQQLQSMNQALSDLLSQLELGQMSPEEIQAELERMAGELPEGSLQEYLEDAAQSVDAQELAERIRETLDEIAKQQEIERQRAEALAERREQQESDSQDPRPSNRDGQNEPGSDYLDSNPNDPFGQPGEEGQQNQTSGQNQQSRQPQDSERDGENSGQQDGQQSGEGANQPTQGDVDGGDQSAQSNQQSEQGQANQQSETGESNTDNPSGQQVAGSNNSQQSDEGGDEAGLGPGDRGEGNEGDNLATKENLVIKGADLPQDPELLERLLTLGIPVDLEQAEGQENPTLVINYEKVEALLELRELPPNLKALVRSYFLAITREK